MARFIVLGTAQDGGLPHAGCNCSHCARARSDAGFRRLPAAAGVVSDGRRLLIDATSAFAEQNHRLWESGSDIVDSTERYGAPDAILLTHAHTGHYTGLWQLDRSVLAATRVPVFGPPQTIELLEENEPWSTMAREGFITFEPLAFDSTQELVTGVRITLLDVPHRAEFGTDTAAIRVEGPEFSVLYLPDIDQWRDWDRDLADVVASVDAAYLDGTFWDRPLHQGVPHPPVLETMDRLQAHAEGGGRISFTHLNHNNPLSDPQSTEAGQVLSRRFAIAAECEVLPI